MCSQQVLRTRLLSAGAAGADLELQPNASAPLLRNSKARREWIEQEMELCSTSWQYQKVIGNLMFKLVHQHLDHCMTVFDSSMAGVLRRLQPYH
jgi:hypothetical protein